MGSVLAPRVARVGLEPLGKRVLALPLAAPVDPSCDGAEALFVHFVVEGGDEAEDLHARGVDGLLTHFPELRVFAPVLESTLEPHEEVEAR